MLIFVKKYLLQELSGTNMGIEILLVEEDFILSKTDLKGKITYCNNKFIEISGYSREELIGKPHNILRDITMPKIAFKILWDKIQNGEDFFGFVRNKTKNNDFYWVFTYVSPDYDIDHKIIGYTSIRRQISSNAISIITPIYEKLLELEKASLFNAEDYLTKTLNDLNLSYSEFVLNIQKGE